MPGQGSVDMIDDGGHPSLLLNGDPRGQDVSNAEYNARVMDADTEYARLLKVLIAALESRPPHHSSAGV